MHSLSDMMGLEYAKVILGGRLRCNPEHSKQVPVEYAEMSEVINRRSDTNGQNTGEELAGEELALRKDSVAHNVRWWHTSITSQRQQKVLHTKQEKL